MHRRMSNNFFENYSLYQPSGFSETIFKERYAFTEEETFAEACARVAKQAALAEAPDRMKLYEDYFREIINKNLFVPGGRILYNSGRAVPQLLNCFVLTSELDSKEGWGNLAREMIITSMTGGGCGVNFSDVRPNGAPIYNSRGTCPGPVALMELIDNCSEPVRAGGDRRVALMFDLDLQHPDIMEFLDAKLGKGKLSHANISVLCHNTSEFIDAVKNDKTIELAWKSQFKKEIPARLLWDKIVTNSYNCAEPGFLNWELVESESNIHYIEPLVSTNPCGEICLSQHDCCCLGHLVLYRFVQGNDLDWAALSNTIRLGVRFLDNVLTVNKFPLDEMKEKSHKLRRIGLGVTGMADMLALLGLRYGSPEANKFVDKMWRFISKIAYESSVMLAIEKGPYPACNPEKILESGFVKRMTPKIKSLIAEHGMRNCALLTIAPTGTVSILSENCSSGIEPMFAPAYERRFWTKVEGRKDVRQTELVFHPMFAKFMAEGRDVSHFVSSRELTVREHMEMQKIVQRHVDNAVSKTINVPMDYPMEDISKLWLEYLPFLKGTTFYRENTRGYVDDAGVIHEPPLTAIPLEDAVELYKHEDAIMVGSEEDTCKSGMCSI